jgi:hypothetical protein
LLKEEIIMTSKWVDERDLRFILHEVFNISEVILGKAPFADHDKDMVNMVLDAAVKFAEKEIAPTYPDEVHRKPVEAVFKDGKVFAPEIYHRLWKLYAEGGWFSIADSPEVGGQGLPEVVGAACMNMFFACNEAFIMYPSLTHGAAKLVEKFCSEELKAIYLNKMFEIRTVPTPLPAPSVSSPRVIMTWPKISFIPFLPELKEILQVQRAFLFSWFLRFG